jgi:hypothetical protein
MAIPMPAYMAITALIVTIHSVMNADINIPVKNILSRIIK